MGRIANRIINAETDQIRRLLEDNTRNWTDDEIMEELKIKRTTYYDRKFRIALQDRELWQKSRREPLEKKALDILKSLNECYETCKKIRDDTTNASDKDRIEAAKMAIKAKVNIYYLMENGPSPALRIITSESQQSKEKLEHRRLIQ